MPAVNEKAKKVRDKVGGGSPLNGRRRALNFREPSGFVHEILKKRVDRIHLDGTRVFQ